MKERACIFDPNLATLLCYPEDEEYEDVEELGGLLHHIEYGGSSEDVIILDGVAIDNLRKWCGEHLVHFIEAHEYAHYWLSHSYDARPIAEKELEADLFASLLVPELEDVELIITTRQGNYCVKTLRNLIPKFLEYKRTIANEPKPIPEQILS